MTAQFRSLFRRHAAGVAIITARTPEGPVGFTASSLASVSTDPPMVSFNVSRTSSSWVALQESTHVGVHLLTAADAELAVLFACRGAARFEGVAWSSGAHGVPLLGGPGSWLACAISHRVEAGDSTVLIAQVLEVGEVGDAGGPAHGASPLVYVTGAYAQALPI